MEAQSEARKKLIEHRIWQAKESAKSAEVLIHNAHWSAAVNRIYFGMYYMLLAVVRRNDTEASNHQEVVEWFEESLIKENIVPSQLLEFIQNAYKSQLAADYEAFVEFSRKDVEKMLQELNEFIHTLEQIQQRPQEIIPKLMECIKTALAWSDTRSSNKSIINETADKLLNFVSERLFSGSQRAVQTLQDFKVHRDNQKVEGNLEIRIEDAFQVHDNLISGVEDLISEFNAVKEQNADISQSQSQTTASTAKVTDNKQEKPIIVPWDFSTVAEFALEHAVNFANRAGGEIHLLHIVKKEKEAPDAEQKMQPTVQAVMQRFGKKVNCLIREGDIFTDISKISDDMHAQLVVMGTHGMKGMQKFLGSWALKVIANTKAPFLVVQASPVHSEIKTVLFPVDHVPDTKRKLIFAEDLHKLYKPKFIICKPGAFATDLIRDRTINNFVYVKSYMNQSGMEFEVMTMENIKNAADAALQAAEQINPDMIMIVTTKGIGFQDYVVGADEQKIIANNFRLPVMCINPLEAKGWGFNSGTSGY